MTVAVHQIVPSFASRDAVGGHAARARDVLRDAGYESEIYSAAGGEGSRPYRRLEGGDGTWLLYQFSLGSDLTRRVLGRPEPLIVSYHNVTPAELFRPWDLQRAHAAEAGRHQLRDLAARAELGLAVSRFNERELSELGFRRTAVAPLLLDLRPPAPADETAAGWLGATRAAGGADVLYVGRITPNKAHHDLLRGFALYRRLHDPLARLHLVGHHTSVAYVDALVETITDLGLDDSVALPGAVPDVELAAYYATCDVYVSLSDHEGFCAPLLEAMHHGLPVIAFAAAAVPETLGDGGLLLPAKDPALVAAAIQRVVSDDRLRKHLVAAGRARLSDRELTGGAERLLEAVRSVTGPPAG